MGLRLERDVGDGRARPEGREQGPGPGSQRWSTPKAVPAGGVTRWGRGAGQSAAGDGGCGREGGGWGRGGRLRQVAVSERMLQASEKAEVTEFGT